MNIGTAPGPMSSITGTTSPTRGSWRTPTVLGVWAHPDDETYLSAALMRRVVAAGGRVVVLTATRGERGSDDPNVDRATLAHRRTGELEAALGELGVAEVSFLDHPDGECADVPLHTGAAAVERAIVRTRPHLVVTFGPDGITGHPDHVAVHRWTTEAWRNVHRQPGALPDGAQLLYATMTHDFVARHRRDLPTLPLTLVGEPVSIPSAEVAVRIDPTDDELRRKTAALDAHASQTDVLVELVGRERLHAWWQTETFRRPTAVELTLGDAAGPGGAAVAIPSPHRLQTRSKPRRHRSFKVKA